MLAHPFATWGLTIRSTGHFAAVRAWASFHSRPSPVFRKMPVSSNVRPREHDRRRIMKYQTIYGALMIAYVIPYLVWTFVRDQKVEILKQFYPGRVDDQAIERRGNWVGGVWLAGMVFLLVGWKLEWHPIPIFGIIAIGWAVFAVMPKIPKAKDLLRARRTRTIVATAAVWFLTVLCWHLVFGVRYDFELKDTILIALVPCAIGFFAYGAYCWVKRGQS